MKFKDAKICYTAIFRNESKNVYRCLNALKDIIEYVCITDTGSEDNTIELIEKWGLENNKPTKVFKDKFKDFGYNRSRSFTNAKKAFPKSDYCLLIDADMVFVLEEGWQNIELTEDKYHLNQKNESIIYKNTRIIRTSLEWRCYGVTHEYWSTKIGINHTTGHITSFIWIDDKNDGGHKHDKYTRDERLLREGLDAQLEPYDPPDIKTRYTYYLAQTLQCLKKYPEAISFFRKRISLGGWDEEIFYSQYQIGACYENMKDYERAAASYLEAWNLRTTRSEPLYSLSKMYRTLEKKELGLMIALRGKKVFKPDDGLFLDYNVYEWGFDNEISIMAYWIPNYRHKGKKSVKKLLRKKGSIPQGIYELAYHNAKHYGIDPDAL